MRKPLKPRVLGDIKASSGKKKWDAFSRLPERINLNPASTRDLTAFIKSMKIAVAFAGIGFFILGSAAAPTFFSKADSTTSTDAVAERTALEAQLKDLETQIGQYEDQVTSYQKQGKSLSNEIKILNDKIAKLNLQIQAVNLTLGQLNKQISDTQSQIQVTEDDITRHKTALGQLVRNVYEADQASLLEVFLKSPSISSFFTDLNDISLLQSDLQASIAQITDLQGQLKDKQDQFQLAKSDAESVQKYEAAQKSQIADLKDQKNQLLTVTKGQESKYQALLVKTKQTAAQIRSRIFQLLGGGELSFEDAYQYAKLASGATGVPPELILAVLDRESALGQNVGKCSYQTAMSPSNQPIFLQITSDLKLNPDVMTVSCPNADGVYGGAMGPAQFVPSTWQLYADGVSKITGNNPASPWNNADAFAATALYLKDMINSQSCIGYSKEIPSQSKILLERCAAAKYYAGSRWYNYRWTYGEAVVQRAQSFADDIATISSS